MLFHMAHPMRPIFFRGAKGDIMRLTILIMKGLAWIILAMLFIPPEITAQDFEQSEQTDKFSKEELYQMLAPIALYPDSLLTQILMASTYPLEIVQAERWIQAHNNLKGGALDKALKEKSWDPSIKSLCYFPDVLFEMSEKLDQTSKLGDAFLSQEDDVMACIQELRWKAENQGNLRTTDKQKVIYDEDIIRIEPANQRIVYVPIYDPLYVYGPWWYPAFPPYYWYYPPGVIITGGFISFGPYFYIGIDLFSWSRFDWHRHHIYIDCYKMRRFHRCSKRHHYPRYFWRHKPVHRRGVAYRDRKTSKQFGKRPYRRSLPGSQIRGYPPKHHKTKVVNPSRHYIKPRKSDKLPRIKTQQRKIYHADGHRKKQDLSQVENRRKKLQHTQRSVKSINLSKPRPEKKKIQKHRNPFHGLGNGSFERRASQRGIQSRQGKGTKYHGHGSPIRRGSSVNKGSRINARPRR